MTESYHVRLSKERFVFSASHFITYAGDVCEPLHGHNYHVEAEIFGPLDANQYVVDFIVVRDSLQAICDALDHRMLLPLEHPTIHVSDAGDEVEVTHGTRRWVFPRGDCVLLPLANTTAELLARHIATLLAEALQSQAGFRRHGCGSESTNATGSGACATGSASTGHALKSAQVPQPAGRFLGWMPVPTQARRLRSSHIPSIFPFDFAMNDLRRAAVLLASLPEEEAVAILSRLDPKQVEMVSIEIARLKGRAEPKSRNR